MTKYEIYHAGVKGMKWGVRKNNPYGRVLKKNSVTAVNRLSQIGIVGGITYGAARLAKRRGKKATAAVLSTIGTLSVAGLGAAMVTDFVKNDGREAE